MQFNKAYAVLPLFLILLFFSLPALAGDSRVDAQKLAEEASQLLDTWRGDGSILEEAKTAIDDALAKDAASPQALKELARYYVMSGYINQNNFRPGSLEQAEEALKKAIRTDPKFPGAYILLGHVYYNMRRMPQAKDALSTADQLGTKDPWLQLNWADVLIAEGKLDEAAVRYKKVIDSGTNNRKAMLGAFSGLISYYYKSGKMADVDVTFKKQLEYEPTAAWAYGNYANFLLCAMDNYEEAIIQGRKALSLMDYGMGHFILGSALYRKWAHYEMFGTPAEATSILREARGVYPDMAAVIANSDACPAVSVVEQVVKDSGRPH